MLKPHGHMAVPDVHFHDISMIFCRHPSRFCGQNSPNFVIAELPKKTVTICSWLFTWGWWHRAKCIWTKKSSIFPSRIKPRKIRGHRLGWLWNPDVSLSFFVAWLHHYKASHPVRRKSPENFKKSLCHLEGSSTQAFQGLFVKPLLFHL